MWMSKFIVDIVEEINYNITGVGDTAQTYVCDSSLAGKAPPCQGDAFIIFIIFIYRCMTI